MGVIGLTVVALQIVADDVVLKTEQFLADRQLVQLATYFDSNNQQVLALAEQWGDKKQIQSFFRTQKQAVLASVLRSHQFLSQQVDFIALINSDNDVLLSRHLLRPEKKLGNLPSRLEYQLSKSAMSELLKKNETASGHIASDRLYSMAIVPVYEKEEGGAVGHLVLGRELSPEIVSQQTLTAFELEFLKDVADKSQKSLLQQLSQQKIVYLRDSSTLKSVALLKDIFGKTVATYSVTKPAFNFSGVLNMSHLSIIVFSLTGLCLVAFAWWLSKKNLIGDLQKLSHDIHHLKIGQDRYGRLDLKDRHLLADLVKNINQKIGGMEQSQDNLSVENRLQDAEVLLDMLPVAAYMKNTELCYVTANQNFCESTGISAEDLLGKKNSDVKSDLISVEDEIKELEVIKSGKGVIYDEQLESSYRGITYYQVHLIPMKNSRNVIEGVVGVRFDITAHKHAESEMIMASKVLENTAEGVMVTNAESRIIHVNHAYTEMTGYSEEEVLGKVPLLLQSEHQSRFYQDIQKSLKEKGEWHGELWSSRRDGTSYPEMISIKAIKNSQNEITNYFSMSNDITEQKEWEQQLYKMAHYDALTDLPNRVLFKDRLLQEMKRADRSNKNIAILYLDLDLFKSINDSLGHAAGDELLKKVAERLGTTLRKGDSISRMGGDEFTILVTELAHDYIKNVGYLTRLCEKIIDVVKQGLVIEGREINVTCSIGVTVYPVDGEAVDDLLRNADTAMYYAKSQGRRNYQFYSKEFNEQAVDRFEKEIEFRSALKNGELEIYYQPQVDVISRHVVGAEALLRWRKNGQDVMGPHKIIALAEETGLIYELGTWILKSACIECKKWMDLGHRHLRVAVNLSTRQFRQKNLVDIIEDILQQTGLPAKLLELEVTESALMENVDYSVEMMADLARTGIRWSLDDFGTGYSSLNYLRSFPVHVLKVDQSFVREITINPEDAAIVETIIDLAHRLHLTVIAEGVESEEQLKALSRMNCEQVQGYYFSKPMKADDFVQYISGVIRE